MNDELERILYLMNLINSIRGNDYFCCWSKKDVLEILQQKKNGGNTGGYSFSFTDKYMIITPSPFRIKKKYIIEG